ncbi:MAG: redox-sensing transcriptional repressor Rex [Chloroflexi bacterium]|nr:redox-sensing transcriptional repressor Rex [Chloroflexota bacterium]
MTDKLIPDIVVGRLPRYLRAIQQMSKEGFQTTSSQVLGERLGISAAQIRKDLSQFGEFGKQGTGYPIPYLIQQLQHILKINRKWEMVLVGVGDLGHAIARYQGFANGGFHITMVFDNDPKKIGSQVGDYIVKDIALLDQNVRAAGIKIAMLTVPASEAQTVADCLVQSGIQSILNYAPVTLTVPPHVHVQNIDPVINLQRMTYYLD